jgi:NB-ARC domain
VLLNLIKGSRLFILLYIVLFTWSAFCFEETSVTVEKRLNPVAYFVDRTEQTKDIRQNLISHRIVSLIGVTSIGKTEIARKYALQNREKYELVWFFDSNLDLNEQFVLLAKKINETLLSKSQNKVSEEVEKAQKEIMNFLTERKNWLLVFDNLKLNQNQKLYPIINWNHNGHIIICAQDASSLPNKIYIHQLDKENAMKLLQEILGNDKVSKELLERLVDIFKGYPGPIVQGALLLKEHKYLSIDEYKNILIKSTNPVKKHMELVLDFLHK